MKHSNLSTVILFLLAALCSGFWGCAEDDTTIEETRGVALVMSFDNEHYCIECFELTEGTTSTTAADILQNSSLYLSTQDFGAGLGLALCGAGPDESELTGCSAEQDQCFCSTTHTWAVYTKEDSTWQSTTSGISDTNVGAGSVLGIRWTEFDPESFDPLYTPHDLSFAEVCTKSNLLAQCF